MESSSQSTVISQSSNDYIKTETSKRHDVLKLEKIERVVLSMCKSTHDFYKCGGCCSNKFKNPQFAIDSIYNLK